MHFTFWIANRDSSLTASVAVGKWNFSKLLKLCTLILFINIHLVCPFDQFISIAALIINLLFRKACNLFLISINRFKSTVYMYIKAKNSFLGDSLQIIYIYIYSLIQNFLSDLISLAAIFYILKMSADSPHWKVASSNCWISFWCTCAMPTAAVAKWPLPAYCSWKRKIKWNYKEI